MKVKFFVAAAKCAGGLDTRRGHAGPTWEVIAPIPAAKKIASPSRENGDLRIIAQNIDVPSLKWPRASRLILLLLPLKDKT